MKYLCQELCENSRLSVYTEDLCQFLGEMKAGYSYCVELIVASNDDKALCKKLSKIDMQEDMLWQFYTSSGRLMKLILQGWKIQNGPQMTATASLLQFCRPNTLSVFLPTDDRHDQRQLVTLMQAVRRQNFQGNLKLYFKDSRLNIRPNDDVILSLRNAS